MKVIFSRKGFDSGTGKVPSPIFPSGQICSLPIPEPVPHQRGRQYKEIKFGNRSLGVIVNELTKGRIGPEAVAHLDPDLNFDSLSRLAGWRPIFGQAGASERHLQKMGVEKGDLFLFFGWFRQVAIANGKYHYVKQAPSVHMLYGWLQVGERIPATDICAIPRWARGHPHCNKYTYKSTDSIYIASKRLELPEIQTQIPGGGIFQKYSQNLRLTAHGESRSIWRLPIWFYPQDRKSSLSYHSDMSRWKRSTDSVLLRTVGRGQEFVLDCNDYPEATGWVLNNFFSCLTQ